MTEYELPELNVRVEDEYWTVATVSAFTGRSETVIWNWIRKGILPAIKHPNDPHAYLVKWSDAANVHSRQPFRGHRTTTRKVIRESDGQTITIRA